MLNLWKANLKNNKSIISETTVTTENLKKYLEGSKDIVFQEIFINSKNNLKVTLVYVDGLVNIAQINETVIKPMIQQGELSARKDEKEIIELVEHCTVYYASQKTIDRLEEVITCILNGFSAIIFDKEEKAVVFETKGFEKRSITEPSDENVIKGAKECFIESLRTNTSLIRRKIRSHNLKIEEISVGKLSETPIAIAYMDNLVDSKLLEKVRKRISNIKTDDILSVGDFEEQVIDNKRSIFPQVKYTERPDRVCSNIMEGRIGVIIDGFPTVYIIPSVLSMFLQSPEDYSVNYFMGSFIRILRYICAFITVLLPGFYIAVMTFHQEMIPTDLAISIIKSKQGVPFNTFIEVIAMLLAFEVLLEAGARLPKTIGQTISIVGGLVVGDAAVNAKFVSPGVVVIVAIAAICGFVIPNQDFSNALRITRLLLVIAASIAGLFGIAVAAILIGYYLSTIETFGKPYLAPFSSQEGKEMFKDTLIRKSMGASRRNK